jgi:hypothetical protein
MILYHAVPVRMSCLRCGVRPRPVAMYEMTAQYRNSAIITFSDRYAAAADTLEARKAPEARRRLAFTGQDECTTSTTVNYLYCAHFSSAAYPGILREPTIFIGKGRKEFTGNIVMSNLNDIRPFRQSVRSGIAR